MCLRRGGRALALLAEPASIQYMGGATITAQAQTGTAAALPARTAPKETSLFVLPEGCIEKKAIAAVINAFIEQQP